MLQHDYTNHAFCSGSELHLSSPPRVQRSFSSHSLKQKRSPQSTLVSANSTLPKKNEHFLTQKRSQFKSKQLLASNRPYLEDRTSFKTSKKINAGFGSEYEQNALVPIEELPSGNNYAVVPDLTLTTKRYSNLAGIRIPGTNKYVRNSEGPHSFEDVLATTKVADQYISSYPLMCDELSKEDNARVPTARASYKKNDKGFSGRFSNKLLLVVDNGDNEFVDENQETNDLYNRYAHRYSIIPTGVDNDQHELNPDVEKWLNTASLNKSQQIFDNFESDSSQLHISNSDQYSSEPHSSISPRNLGAANVFHNLSSPSKTSTIEDISFNRKHLRASSSFRKCNKEMSLQTLPILESPQNTDRNTAVISPLVAVPKIYPQMSKSANDNLHSQITLTIVPLMLTLGSAMNSCLIIYLVAHLGKLFYLQYSLVAAFCGVGLGALGFRARHCMWVPNRGYISGFILVTIICLLKCCGLLVILVYDPYPGLPLHDVTTGIILSLSTFIMFFIGLGIIGSLWCYRPPPDNRINVI